MADDQGIARRDYIAAVMEKQKLKGNPRKFIVLRRWNEIVDHDSTYEIRPPLVPLFDTQGMELYVIMKPDSPELGLAKVIEDRGPNGLFVEPLNVKHKIQFLVPREDARVLPIPLRPTAIRRSDLRLYIGDEAAKVWHEHRRAKCQ